MMRGLGYQSHHFAPGTSGATLNFNFLNDGLDPRITFTRASNATQFNSAGTLVYAPHNLILDSEDWSTASWNRLNCTFSYNAATAPNGTLTADLLIPNNGSTIGRTTQFVSTLPDLVSCVLSVYVKNLGLTNVIIQVVDKSNTTQSSQTLNLSTGALSGSIDAGTTTTVTNVGDNWYRLSFAITSISSGATTPVWTIRCSSTGNGTDGILLWGAQLNVGSLQSYNQTTSSAYYGPRLDYNPSTLAAQGLLIEEQRTNSIRNNTMQGAVAGAPGTLPTNWGFVAGTTGIASEVVGTGTENGVTYIDIRYSGTAASTSSFSQRFEGATTIAAVTGQTWGLSSWAKIQAGTTNGISAISHQYIETNNVGGFVTGAAIAISVTSAWQRFSTSRTNSGGATVAFITGGIAVTVTSGQAIDITLRIGLPQLEQGAFATSVIPTTTTALTRSADVASVNTLSPWYNATEGTLFAEAQHYAPSVATAQFQAQLASASNDYYVLFKDSSPANLTARVRSGGVDSAYMYTTGVISANTTYKNALAYAVNDFAACANGGTVQTDTSGALPTSITALGLGQATYTNSVQLNGWLRRVTYYPTRLSNAQLQALTA